MNIINSGFFFGGSNDEIPKTTTVNENFLLYMIWVNKVNHIVPAIVIPTIWLSKILKIKWWRILLIILICSEIAVKIANDAVQVLGGYGYTKDFPVERFYRDAKLCTIGEGTSEIQKLVISTQILK